jgi:hypothetical protein
MKIDKVNITGIQPTTGTTPKAGVERAGRIDSSPANAVDRADVRKDLAVESRLMDAARLVLEAIPDVRADKIELAKQRLAEGFYDKSEVRDQIAGAFVADAIATPTPEISARQQSEVKERLSAGFYNSPSVIEKIAEEMVKDV